MLPVVLAVRLFYEFTENMIIIMSNMNNEYKVMSIKELLPGAFNGKDIK